MSAVRLTQLADKIVPLKYTISLYLLNTEIFRHNFSTLENKSGGLSSQKAASKLGGVQGRILVQHRNAWTSASCINVIHLASSRSGHYLQESVAIRCTVSPGAAQCKRASARIITRCRPMFHQQC